jgi:hypothetical protein
MRGVIRQQSERPVLEKLLRYDSNGHPLVEKGEEADHHLLLVATPVST